MMMRFRGEINHFNKSEEFILRKNPIGCKINFYRDPKSVSFHRGAYLLILSSTLPASEISSPEFKECLPTNLK